MKRFFFTAAVSLYAAGVAPAADWPQFRGAGTGVSTEAKLPADWTAEQNVAWKVSVPGVAWSCPIVVGDKVIVTSAVADGQPKPRGGGGGPGGPGGGGNPPGGGRPGGGPGGGGRGAGPDKEYTWNVVCLDRTTGKQIWSSKAAVGKPKYGTHGSNTFASETPASDGERVYSYFGANGVLIAHDLAGKELWKKQIGPFPVQNGWGCASSPVVHDGMVFVQCDNEEKSFLVAFDAKSGDEKWRVSRSERTNWCSPYVWKTKDRTDLVAGGSGKVCGYNPADGKVVWELTVGGGQANASPTGDEERLYFGSGMGGGGRPGGGGPGGPGGGGRPGGGGGGAGMGTLFAIKAGAKGDISLKAGETSNAGVAWTAPRSVPKAATPLVYDGHVYTLEQQGGQVSCFDAKTGKPAYTKERIPNAKAFWASPWAHDGKVFCLDEDGVTHVLKAGPSFEVLRKNTLGKDVYWSSPAVANGSVVLRGVDSLYCIK